MRNRSAAAQYTQPLHDTRSRHDTQPLYEVEERFSQTPEHLSQGEILRFGLDLFRDMNNG